MEVDVEDNDKEDVEDNNDGAGASGGGGGRTGGGGGGGPGNDAPAILLFEFNLLIDEEACMEEDMAICWADCTNRSVCSFILFF